MNRRGFLGTLVGGVAAGAAVRTWPFRIFSFPSEVKVFAPVDPIIGNAFSLEKADELMRIYYKPAIVRQFNTTALLWKRWVEQDCIPISSRSIEIPVRPIC
jgi:hypothetical protein